MDISGSTAEPNEGGSPEQPPPAPVAGPQPADSPAPAHLVTYLAVYTVLRVLLVAVLTAVLMIFMPLIVALLFAIIVQLPLSWLIFAGPRKRLNDAMAQASQRRRAERARLQSALSGDDPGL